MGTVRVQDHPKPFNRVLGEAQTVLALRDGFVLSMASRNAAGRAD